MSAKRIAGFALIASPFVALAALIVIQRGWLAAVQTFGLVALIVGVIYVGVEWSLSE